MHNSTHWREDLSRWITSSASAVDDFIDIRWQCMKKRFGWDGVPKIQPYIGYANQHRVWLHGRVLTNPPADLPQEDSSWWDNIADTYQRFASDEVAGCEVEVRLGDAIHRTTTDAEGYFFINADHRFPDSTNGLWSQAAMQIVNHPKAATEDTTATCKVMTPSSNADFGIISDVDDTILHTGATRLLTMARVTFLGNARTRLPLEGAASFYRAMQGTHRAAAADRLNPIFYVSSSPWNLFDLLEDFLELNDIPLGPLLLRDLGFDENKFLKQGHDHKLEKTRQILNAYEHLPFVLIGDSGQEDARLYATAAEEFGTRIKAIFIRDVDPQVTSNRNNVVAAAMVRAKSAGVPMHLVCDSTQAAEIASKLNLLDESDLPAIQIATARDHDRSVLG